MKKYGNMILIVLSIVMFSGCAKKVYLTDFSSGTQIEGVYKSMDKEVIVTMPNGEILKGHYVYMANATFSMTNVNSYAHAYSGTVTASGYGNAFAQTITSGGTSKVYALLKSTSSNLMMEIILDYSEWSGQGYGEARTNRGKKYKVQV